MKISAEHPYVRMQLDLESVDEGWRRIWNCHVCGKSKIGHTGKTVNTHRITMYCNGEKVTKGVNFRLDFPDKSIARKPAV